MELTIDQALQQGVEAHKAGQVQEADRLYTAILKVQPKHPDANHNLGVVAVGVGKVEEALPLFKTALEANPDITQFWLSYIDALIKLKRLSKAEAMLDQAKQKGAKGDEFDSLERQLLGTNQTININLKNQEPPQEQLEPLLNLYSQGRLQKVLLEASQMLTGFPNSVNLNHMIGVANNGLGQLNAAIKAYNKVLSIKPDYAEAYNNMGNVLQKQGKLEEAIEAYKKALTIKPDYAQAFYNMANALHDQGNFDESIEVYNKVLAFEPSYVDAHYNLGNALKAQGNMNEAIKSYTKTVTLKPDYVQAFLHMGDANLDLGKMDRAIDAYNKALAIKPDFAEAFNNKAFVLTEMGEMTDAIKTYKKALALKPNHIEFSYNLAYLFFITQKYEEAARLFKKSESTKSQTYLLKCFYEQDDAIAFSDQLDYLVDRGENNAVIGSYISRSQIRYKFNKTNPFCNDPLKYVFHTNLVNRCDFGNIFVRGCTDILTEDIVQNRSQSLLTNGIQTTGNVFDQIGDFTDSIQSILRSEIEKYHIKFKDSQEGLIKSWPSNYEINGWLVSMKSGGSLAAHMHDKGWISGSVYVNVPSKVNEDSGNLVLTSWDGEHEKGDTKNRTSIDVVTGSLCLFPSSLLHYTIPFEAEEDRIVLAFDVIPN